MGETRKAFSRRKRERFFDLYVRGRGIDIGVGRIDSEGADPVLPDADAWDKDDGDATFMRGIPDESYDYVYASHVLEHISNCHMALRNWWRILRPGGYLILFVPHRDLYEKRNELPSRWNPDHRYFLLPDSDELPDTLGLRSMVEGSLPLAEIIYLKICAEGHTLDDPDVHSDGEYSIEMVLSKRSP